MTGFKRWAAILLPFVILARVILLMFQLRDEHQARAHRDDPPAWPATPGEELHFRADWPHVASWLEAESHPQLLVPLLERDFLPVDGDSGCVLDLWAVLHHGGTLTVRPPLQNGAWGAEWNGGRTVPTRAELTGKSETELRVLDAADCGGSARLELTGYQLHVLVAALSDAPFPDPPNPPPLVRPVHIHVPGPPPPPDPPGEAP